MIKYEHNTLVLDSSHTKEDQKAVNDFVNFRVSQEREKIAKILSISPAELERKLTQFPPVYFRDRSNGE